MTVRRLGPGPHQLRGLDPGGCDADHGPKRRTKKLTQGGEQTRSGRAGGEPRGGEGAVPPGAPSGALGDASATRELADAVRGLTHAVHALVRQPAAKDQAVTWSEMDAQFAHAARDLRPLADKSVDEMQILARMRARRSKDGPA